MTMGETKGCKAGAFIGAFRRLSRNLLAWEREREREREWVEGRMIPRFVWLTGQHRGGPSNLVSKPVQLAWSWLPLITVIHTGLVNQQNTTGWHLVTSGHHNWIKIHFMASRRNRFIMGSLKKWIIASMCWQLASVGGSKTILRFCSDFGQIVARDRLIFVTFQVLLRV